MIEEGGTSRGRTEGRGRALYLKTLRPVSLWLAVNLSMFAFVRVYFKIRAHCFLFNCTNLLQLIAVSLSKLIIFSTYVRGALGTVERHCGWPELTFTAISLTAVVKLLQLCCLCPVFQQVAFTDFSQMADCTLPRQPTHIEPTQNPNSAHPLIRQHGHFSSNPDSTSLFKMVIARSLPRFLRPASSFLNAAAAARSSATARGATCLRQRFATPQIRTLTGAREKVKVLLVLYDGQSQTSSTGYKMAQLKERLMN